MSNEAGATLVVGITGNISEWRATLHSSMMAPRLPLPYAFGAALLRAGFTLLAVDQKQSSVSPRESSYPFDQIYALDETQRALAQADAALLWGSVGLKATLRCAIRPRGARAIILCTYAWKPLGSRTALSLRIRLFLLRQGARLAKGVVVMTAAQESDARKSLPRKVKVLRLQVGIDTAFYCKSTERGDLTHEEEQAYCRIAKRPYVVLAGDELRMNEDALEIVAKSDYNLVRILQYPAKSGGSELRSEVKRRGLDERVAIMEGISYSSLRFMFQNATAYAGVVDSSWQPAGWTVACEALACGLAVLIYDGLTSRELQRLGLGKPILHVVPMRDINAFVKALGSVMRTEETTRRAKDFAKSYLDLEVTGAAFAQDVRTLMHE